eukprot:1156961-Pelagomonas_calceolata.AAC.9
MNYKHAHDSASGVHRPHAIRQRTQKLAQDQLENTESFRGRLFKSGAWHLLQLPRNVLHPSFRSSVHPRPGCEHSQHLSSCGTHTHTPGGYLMLWN